MSHIPVSELVHVSFTKGSWSCVYLRLQLEGLDGLLEFISLSRYLGVIVFLEPLA